MSGSGVSSVVIGEGTGVKLAEMLGLLAQCREKTTSNDASLKVSSVQFKVELGRSFMYRN